MQGGILLACMLKLLLPFIMLVPGIISSVMSESVRADPNTAFPVLIISVIPSPLMGLICAAVLAALMSSIASVFSSGATIFTIDIYARWLNPAASDRQKIRVGRLVTVAMTVAGILWIPVISLLSKSLYIYTHKIMSYYAPPITVIFVIGVVWPRANSRGAATGFVTGMCIGTLRLLMEVLYVSSSGMLGVFAHGNFLYFSACHGAFIVLLVAAVSLATAPPPQERTQGLTWATRRQAVLGAMLQHEDTVLRFARESDSLELPVVPDTHGTQDFVADGQCPMTASALPCVRETQVTDEDDDVGLIRDHHDRVRVEVKEDRLSANLVLRFGGFVR
jgi:SSS family solute:Na+ symporter